LLAQLLQTDACHCYSVAQVQVNDLHTLVQAKNLQKSSLHEGPLVLNAQAKNLFVCTIVTKDFTLLVASAYCEAEYQRH
jgi:hypothetical protein